MGTHSLERMTMFDQPGDVAAGNNFTFDDWVAHRSTTRYARHIAGLLK